MFKTDSKLPMPQKPRCAYCIDEGAFREMRVLENGRQICEHCGHIIFPEDRAFWCPCAKCVEVHFSLKDFFSTKPKVAGDRYSPVGIRQYAHSQTSGRYDECGKTRANPRKSPGSD